MNLDQSGRGSDGRRFASSHIDGEDHSSDYTHRELGEKELQDLKDNKYMKRIGSINDQSVVAEKLDVLKLNYMADLNPSYPLCSSRKA